MMTSKLLYLLHVILIFFPIICMDFHRVKQTVLPNDTISLIQFDHLVFPARSRQYHYIFPQL